MNRYSFWIRAAIQGFASPFIFRFALHPKKESSNVWVTLANLPRFFFFFLTLVASTVGNEAGNDLRKRLIPPSVSKNPSVHSFEPAGVSRPSTPTSPTSGLSSHFKDGRDLCVTSGQRWPLTRFLHEWKQRGMSSNLRPAESERFSSGGVAVFTLWLKEIKNIYLQGFRAGKWHPAFGRLEEPTERNPTNLKGSPDPAAHFAGVFLFFFFAQSPFLQIFIKARFSVKALSVAKNIIFTSPLKSNDES